jgi:hypothetical protein
MVELTVDPEVKTRVEACRKKKETCKVSDFDDLIKEDAFKKRLE